MKLISVITLLLAMGIQLMQADTAPVVQTLTNEFQGFSAVNVATMNGYDWAVIREILNRGAELSDIKIKTGPTFFNGVIEVTIAGPHFEDDYKNKFAIQIGKLTNSLLAAVSPFLESTQLIHIGVMPGNANLV